MLTRHIPRSRRFLFVFRGGVLLFGFYLAFHAFHGNHGLLALSTIEDEIAALQTQHAELEERRAFLERRVAALQTDALDGDLVDDQARRTLAVIGGRELILREPIL